MNTLRKIIIAATLALVGPLSGQQIVGNLTVQQYVRTADGTAAAPSSRFTTYPTTGFFLSGANAIGVSTAGVERWTFNASGSLNPLVNNTYDIGNGSVNPRDVNAARSFIGPLLTNASTLTISTTASNANVIIAPHGTGQTAFGGAISTTPRITFTEDLNTGLLHEGTDTNRFYALAGGTTIMGFYSDHVSPLSVAFRPNTDLASGVTLGGPGERFIQGFFGPTGLSLGLGSAPATITTSSDLANADLLIVPNGTGVLWGSLAANAGRSTIAGQIVLLTGAVSAKGGIEFQDSQSSSGYGSKILATNSTDALIFQSRYNSANWTTHLSIAQQTGLVSPGVTGQGFGTTALRWGASYFSGPLYIGAASGTSPTISVTSGSSPNEVLSFITQGGTVVRYDMIANSRHAWTAGTSLLDYDPFGLYPTGGSQDCGYDSATQRWRYLYLSGGASTGINLGYTARATIAVSADTTAGVLTINGPSDGSVAIKGTVNADAAAAGYRGELLTGQRLVASTLGLTTATAADITSVSLTAGDWEVTGTVHFIPANTTVVASLIGSVSATTATQASVDSIGGYASIGAVYTSGGATMSATPIPIRISVAATTTYYLVATGTFSISTCTAYGTIRARRVR